MDGTPTISCASQRAKRCPPKLPLSFGGGVVPTEKEVPWAYPRLCRKRHLDRCSSFCTTHDDRHTAVPRTRTTLGDSSFAVAGPRVWNSLPATVRQITSYGQFRQHLKKHLFRAWKSQRTVTLDCCALYKYSYLLTYTDRWATVLST